MANEKEVKKIIKAMESDNFEQELKEEGFSVYTTENQGKKKKINI
jgi:tRNA G18 (ribose-2'-O)-methylase SpoU